MPRQQRDRSSSSVFGIVIVVLIVAAGIGWWLTRPEPPAPAGPQTAEPAPKVHVPVKDRPVIDYGAVEKDASLQATMQDRKAEYGLDKSLDLILKPEEALKIGDQTVPMAEILEKIRLQKGDIIENDLNPPPDMAVVLEERKSRIEALVALEKRYAELTGMLNGHTGTAAEQEALAREHARLGETVALFTQYKSAIEELAGIQKALESEDADTRASARAALSVLRQRIETLEKQLGIPRIPARRMEAYGIYIVRPGDNIWNIHFKFLKEYFANRQVALAPASDEPDPRGFSSGVGKILKFSENMVYIYNLKEKRLDVDLNLLKPLSKIVIFNMGEVFRLLDPIDYGRVSRIRFDGETLWIPAES